ncbi:DUF5659 domain-containing protein [Bacillus paranthracis]|uniref:DUF5659 domain-containing protein n=1 Tax=Bacillus paranthracis TaxID=2026186 RepID=UPI0007787AAE|nr:DUF5659 domain-containing protein [Bacillus paranthracis]KXY07450.1 hypothetical protein AT271_06460 [Bacillus cereus]MCC2437288.1 DUF5659 domain-containing protein [Bacillus paranthracis]MDG1605781.1 DUF5659 domain-containing protein [Bacillus paranthracis]
MNSTKRIFGITMANYLIQNGIKLIEIRAGEVTGKSDRPTFLFKNDERLIEVMKNYKKRFN